MIEEISLINHWLKSKDVGFLHKHNIDRTYFFVLKNAVTWIEDFIRQTGTTPSPELVATEFEDFKKLENLDSVDYIISKLKEEKLYTEYRPVLESNAALLNDGKVMEAVWKMKSDAEALLTKYTASSEYHDWVKHALKRYDMYMEKHGQSGLAGIPTGISKLDELTGGWKDDDLILVTARLSEGKSLLGGYFTYHAWRYVQEAGVNAPVIYISTEMPELEIAYRMDTLKYHLSNTELSQGKLKDADLYRECLEELQKKDSSLLILGQDANGGRAYTPADIQRLIYSERPALICIDQLYDIDDGTGERDIRKRIVNVSTAIRNINLATKTPTILIAQAGRDAAKTAKKDILATPEIHDIQESDNPAQKATKILALRLVGDVLKMTLKKARGGKRDVDMFMRVDIDRGFWEEESPECLAF